MKAFHFIMAPSVHVKDEPGLSAYTSNPSIVEVSKLCTRPFLGEGVDRKDRERNEVGPL